MAFLSKFTELLNSEQVFIEGSPFYCLSASVSKGRNKSIKIIKPVAFENNIFRDSAYLDGSILKTLSSYKKAIYHVQPTSQFIYRTKLEPKVKNQGIRGLSVLIKERFNVDLVQNKVAVLSADTGLEVNENTKEFPDNICIVGAQKSELKTIQEEMMRAKIFLQKLYFTSLTIPFGLGDYNRTFNLKKPIMVIDFSMQRSCVYVVGGDKLLAAYPPTHGFKNLLSLARKECNLPDDISTYRFITSEISPNHEAVSPLLQRMVSDIKSYIDFFEVQIGDTIDSLFFVGLPDKMSWLREALSKTLELMPLKIDYKGWFEKRKVSFDSEANLKKLSNDNWFGMISAILQDVN